MERIWHIRKGWTDTQFGIASLAYCGYFTIRHELFKTPHSFEDARQCKKCLKAKDRERKGKDKR